MHHQTEGKKQNKTSFAQNFFDYTGQSFEAIWLLIQARYRDLNTTWEEHQEVIRATGQTTRQIRALGCFPGWERLKHHLEILINTTSTKS